MLTENGKNWIAEKFGIKVGDRYCYSYDSPTFYWYDPDEKIEKTDSGTANAVSVLVTAHLTGKENEVYVRIGDKKYYYSDLKSANDGYDITLDDAKWVADNDGYPTGENQYCFTPTTPTTPSEPTTPTTPTGLTENGKNWIARNFGVRVGDKYCYSYDAPTFYWYDPDEGVEKVDYGTANAVSVLLTAHLTGKTDKVYVRINNRKYYYSDLKNGNDGQDLTLDDAKWVAEHDGYPAGEPQYCYTPTAPAPGETILCVYAKDKATGEEINAWIFIDGNFTGKSTPECLPVAPGSRTVKLYHPLYKEAETTVSVVSGQTNEVTIEMEKIPAGQPIEIIVVAPCAHDTLVKPIIEPPYSEIPTMIMKGTLVRFRIFFVNNGMACPLDESKTYIYIEKPDTGERYYFNMVEEDIDKVVDARGTSIRFEGTVPLTASTGTYYMYLEWDVKVPPEQRCKFE